MRREEEIDLIRKAKEGDTAAFAVMIRRYQNLVYATAFRILKDPTLAEDVAQEAFVSACGSLLLSILVPQKPPNQKFASRMARGAGGFPAPRAFPEGDSITSFPRCPCAGAPWASRPGRGGARRLRARSPRRSRAPSGR